MFQSAFLTAHDGDMKTISAPCALFDQWLGSKGYQLAVDCAPWDSREFGGYLGAEDAWDLVYDFLDDHPNQSAHLDELQQYAAELGEVSNQWN